MLLLQADSVSGAWLNCIVSKRVIFVIYLAEGTFLPITLRKLIKSSVEHRTLLASVTRVAS